MTLFVFIAFTMIVTLSVAKSLFLKRKKGSQWIAYAKGTESYIRPLEAGISIYGAVVGGFIVFGLVQIGFEGGLTGYILGLAYLIGAPFLIWALKRAKESDYLGKGLLSIDALLRARFGRYTETMFITITSFLFAGILAGQFIAISTFLKEFSGSEVAAVTLGIGCLLTISYTIWFGLRGVLANDILQGLFEFALSIIVPGVVIYEASKNPIHFSLLSTGIGGQYGTAYPFIAGIFLALSFLVRADLWQRLSIVEPKKQSRVLAAVIIGLFFYYVGMTTVGLLLKQNPDVFPFAQQIPATYFVPVIIRELLGSSILQIICVSGLLLALLSSIDSYLNLAGLFVAKLYLSNVDDKELKPDQRDAIQVTNARIATFAIALITVTISLLIPDLVDIISASFGLMGVLVPVVFVALKYKKPIPDFVGAISLFVSLILLIMALPFLKKLAFVPATVIGFVLFGALLTISKNKPYKGE